MNYDYTVLLSVITSVSVVIWYISMPLFLSDQMRNSLDKRLRAIKKSAKTEAL